MATWMLFAAGAAFCQPSNGNNNGQDDCQCFGIGIQNTRITKQDPGPQGNPLKQDAKVSKPDEGLLIAFLRLYWTELTHPAPSRKTEN